MRETDLNVQRVTIYSTTVHLFVCILGITFVLKLNKSVSAGSDKSDQDRQDASPYGGERIHVNTRFSGALGFIAGSRGEWGRQRNRSRL